MPDCLIVGGGVIGLSLAYELSRHGARVHVIDRAEPGREASWAGAGILPPANRRTAIDPWDQLRALSHELHREWAALLREETGIDNGYRECGGLYLARSHGESASLQALAAMLDELEIAVEKVSVADLIAMEPALSELATDGVKAAYLLPGEAQLRNPDHLRALQMGCQQRGVVIHRDVAATGFELSAQRVQGVSTTAGLLEADHYCVASGAWTQALLQLLGTSTGIMPIRGQMVLFKSPKQLFRRVLNEGPRYLVARDDGHVLVGSTEEEVGFDKRTTTASIQELVSFARGLVAPLHDTPIQKTWAGLRPGSFDGFPYIGRVPGLDNAYAAAGHYRSGLHTSPGTAVVLSQLILGRPTEIDLTHFRVGRG